MIPVKLKNLMEQKKVNYYRTDRKAAEQALVELNVPLNSEFAEFFLTYMIPEYRSEVSDEYLCDIASPTPQVKTGTRFVHEVWGVPENYICFTSCQGEGGYLYDKDTGKVWDFDLATRELFIANQIPAKWNGFFDFMIWYLGAD